jgi:excisionase family DNA binding protein
METENWRDRSTITVEQAAPILGIGRSTAYVLARCGELPTLRLGRRYVVPVAGLRRMLGEIEDHNDHEDPAQALVGKAGNDNAHHTG